MKRIVLVASIVLIVFIGSTYIFIPSNIVISTASILKVMPDVANRKLISAENWSGEIMKKQSLRSNKHSFVYGSDTFSIHEIHHSSVDFYISDGSPVKSTLSILPLNPDSVALHWEANIRASINPVTRLQQYNHAVAIKKNISAILQQVNTFLHNEENIYGQRIVSASTRDTFLLAAKITLPNYPTTKDLYQLISGLQQHIEKKGAKQTNAPMVNITQAEKNYNVMVAVPTNIQLGDEAGYIFRRMVPGHFLLAEVTGGKHRIETALENMQLYIKDHKKTSMAIPFYVLVTDRTKETDSTNWVTRIFYPVNR